MLTKQIEPAVTRERFAAYIFIAQSNECSVKTFIGYAASHEEAEYLAWFACQHNPMADGVMVVRQVMHEESFEHSTAYQLKG